MENKVGKFPIVQDLDVPCSSRLGCFLQFKVGILPIVQGYWQIVELD